MIAPTAAILLIIALHHVLQQLIVLIIPRASSSSHHSTASPVRTATLCRHHQLLHAVRIPQRIQRMLHRHQPRRDHRNHARLALLPDERIAQHLRQFAHAERQMGALLAQRSNALLQRQQRLIDLGSLHPCLAIRRRRIGASLIAGQIDERELAMNPTRSGRSQNDLENGMRSRRIRIGRCLARRARPIAMLDDLQHLIDTVDHLLGQPDDLHLLFAILQHAQFLLVRQQIEHLTAVDLEETRRHNEIQMPVAFAVQLCEYVVRGQRVDAVLAVLLLAIELAAHRVRFTGARLAVGETRGHATLEDGVDQRFGRVLVHHFVGAAVVERVVETELVILEKFRQIHLGLGLVHDQLVFGRHTDDVEFFFHQLFAADRTFAHAHGDLVVFDGGAVG